MKRYELKVEHRNDRYEKMMPDDFGDYVLYEDHLKAMKEKEDKGIGFYKDFYEKNRIALLQYESIRENFNKMVNDVLGDDYYNMAMDVYEADRICCIDITRKANRTLIDHLTNYIT